MSADIFDRARRLAAQSGGRTSFQEALAVLGKRGNEARKRGRAGKLGGFTVSSADRRSFDAVESPRFWYMDRD